MKELIKIAKLLDGYKLRQVDIIDNMDSNSRYTQFYKLLKTGKIKTDNDALHHFYANDTEDKQDAYRRFKSQFKQRLLNMLFFIDTRHPHFSDLETATMNIQKEWAAINILFAKDDLELPVFLSEKLLINAIKYELSEIVVYITDRLKNSYGGQIGNFKRYQYHKGLQAKYMEIWQGEIKAKELYQELRMEFIKSNSYKPYLSDVAKEGLAELQPYLDKYNTIRLIYYGYAVKLGQYTTVNDFETSLNLCIEALAVLKSKSFNAERLVASFLNQKLICHIQLKQYSQGRLLLEEVIKLQNIGTRGWFKTLEHSMILAFYTANYGEALAIYTQVRGQKEFNDLKLQHLEIWYLFGAYLYLLISADEIQGKTLLNTELKSFKLTRFLNDVPTFNLDKTGRNVSVLIIQIALMLSENMMDDIIERIEAVNKYRVRHIAKTSNLYRNNVFIKMISHMPVNQFMRKPTSKQVEQKLKILVKETVPVINDGTERTEMYQSEVIPLEDLWTIMMQYLK